jgi:hypothetical protein
MSRGDKVSVEKHWDIPLPSYTSFVKAHVRTKIAKHSNFLGTSSYKWTYHLAFLCGMRDDKFI